MKRFFVLAILIVSLTSCGKKNEMKTGPWLGVIQIDPQDKSLVVPFNMTYSINKNGTAQFEITNADEKIIITEITRNGDTLIMKPPVFTSVIVAVLRNDSLVGKYYPKGIEVGNPYKFYAVSGVVDRFPWYTEKAAFDVTGRWKVIENPGTADSTIMVGEFMQTGDKVLGTFLNTTGDYRYLEGKVSGNKFLFSKMDGAQSLIFNADIKDQNTMENGKFMGSSKWTSKWMAIKDDNIVLPGSEDLVKVKNC